MRAEPIFHRAMQSCWCGGITGITTAIVLQALGLKVGIVSESKPLQSPSQICSPLVPTSYAMASAYPHNLRVKNLERISADSQAAFKLLCERADSGVRIYRMFEVFEQEPDDPPLASSRIEFQAFDGAPAQLKDTIDPPFRPGAEHLWGWHFNTYFADMPRYLPFLWQMFDEQGGIYEQRKVEHGAIFEGESQQPIFNCIGHGAIEFARDKAPSVIMRGRQVLVPHAPMITGRDNVPVAYNYTPPAQVFQRADGGPEYVHFFPRATDWILGQTREAGELGADGLWRGAPTVSPEKTFAGCSIPLPIVDLNEILLQNWLGCTLDRSNLLGRVGYRYYRDPAATGVRLALDNTHERVVVHNYGHGGSGITMSWGCAIESARLFLQAGRKMKPTQTNPLGLLLGKLFEGLPV